MTLIAERICAETTIAAWLTRFQVVCQVATMRMLPPVELYRQVSQEGEAEKLPEAQPAQVRPGAAKQADDERREREEEEGTEHRNEKPSGAHAPAQDAARELADARPPRDDGRNDDRG